MTVRPGGAAPAPPRAGPRVICLGCAFWDTIFPVDRIPAEGGKLLPALAVQNASGMATVAAVTVARLGGNVALWTRIGDDATGGMFVADLERDGVGAAGIRRVPGGRTWFSTILVDARGERLVVAHPAPLDPDPGWLPVGEIAGAGAVLADMRWPEAVRLVFGEARRLRVPTVLDADVAPLEDLRALAPLADHVLFSQPALASLVPDAFPEAALRAVAAGLDARVVGVTLGARGALVWERDGGGTLHRVPAPAVTAVDTLNAGDVWHGTYAFGLAQGWDLARTVEAASVAAAMKCERFGGKTGAPTLDRLLDRLARWTGERAVAKAHAATVP